jgi:hypothetical protein
MTLILSMLALASPSPSLAAPAELNEQAVATYVDKKYNLDIGAGDVGHEEINGSTTYTVQTSAGCVRLYTVTRDAGMSGGGPNLEVQEVGHRALNGMACRAKG